MICGCFCLYNGVTYYLPDKDVDKQPVKAVVENTKFCKPIAKAEYLNEYGVFNLYYQKCSSGKVEDINKVDFNQLDVVVNNDIASKNERLETISYNYIFPIGFVFILMFACLMLAMSIK